MPAPPSPPVPLGAPPVPSCDPPAPELVVDDEEELTPFAPPVLPLLALEPASIFAVLPPHAVNMLTAKPNAVRCEFRVFMGWFMPPFGRAGSALRAER
jgi:hypothetical protein